jgi:hypothetical protein
MVTKDEAKALYEGKFFYEIVKPKTGGIQLFGPFDNIYYTEPAVDNRFDHLRRTWSTDAAPQKRYKFVQVIDGRPVVAFTEEEILVTDRKL